MSKVLLSTLLMLAMIGFVSGCSDESPAEPEDTGLKGTFFINNDDAMTRSVEVELNFDVAGADSMRFHNEEDDWSEWMEIPAGTTSAPWTLSSGDGIKTVFAEFKTTGGSSLALDDDIELDTNPTRILILEDDGSEVGFQRVLVDAGYAVTMGGLYYEYDSADFSGYDLVILLYGYDYGNYIAPEIQQGMKNFVIAGGVLLTTEWLTYEGVGQEEWKTLIDILPLAYNDNYCDYGEGDCSETYTKLVEHPITEGLPETFMTPLDWTYSYQAVNDSSLATNITVLFRGSTSGSALAIGDLGEGHTIHWSMAGVYGGTDIWSTETERILTNIAAFAD